MKRLRSVSRNFRVTLCALAMFALAINASDTLPIQAQLIWGTNDPQPTNSKHKPVDEALAKKLGASPYRWQHYFEIKRLDTTLGLNESKPLSMSEKCRIDIKNLGGDRVEVKLYGEGKPVSKHVEKIATDWPLVLSGNASNHTAWLVVIQKIPPSIVQAKPADKAAPK
jgi:hypothetical protein